MEEEKKKIGRPRTRPYKPGLLERELGPEHADVIAEYKASQNAQRIADGQTAEESGRSPGGETKPARRKNRPPMADKYKGVTPQDNEEAVGQMIELYNLPPIDTGNSLQSVYHGSSIGAGITVYAPAWRRLRWLVGSLGAR